jgi:uncharacterized protein
MVSKEMHMGAFILVIVGALNWGIFGLFKLNLVELLLGSMPIIANLVYILVGISGVYLLTTHKSDCKVCSDISKSKKK